MADTTEMQLSSEELQTLFVERVRDAQPYMRIEPVKEAAREAADTCLALLEGRIAQQQANISDSKARSGFMSLSPELRNRVYTYALLPEKNGDGGVRGTTAIFVGVDVGYEDVQHSITRSYASTKWAKQPALTHVSRQVRVEALPVYYGLNHFLIEYYATSFSRLDERYIYGADIWLENIGRDNRAMLKHVEIKHDADQLGPYLLGGAMGHYRAQTAFEFEALGIVMDEKVRHIVRGHKDRADSWMPFDLNATGKDIRLVLSAEKQARQPGSLAYRGIYAGEYFEEDDEDEEDHEDDEAEEVADEDAEDEV